jgi:hypothetical protein
MKIINQLYSLILMSVVYLHSGSQHPIGATGLIPSGCAVAAQELYWMPSIVPIIRDSINSIFARTHQDGQHRKIALRMDEEDISDLLVQVATFIIVNTPVFGPTFEETVGAEFIHQLLAINTEDDSLSAQLYQETKCIMLVQVRQIRDHIGCILKVEMHLTGQSLWFEFSVRGTHSLSEEVPGVPRRLASPQISLLQFQCNG